MKKIYESPESLAVNIGLHGRLLDDGVLSTGDPNVPADTREYNSIWDDDSSKGGKKIFDEEW